MPTIHSRYLGDLRTEATHLASGNKMLTDAPVDNQGRGEAFSPSDTVCAALGSCMMTIMGIAARTHGINLDGMQADITKFMVSDPRRISKIEIRFYGLNESPDDRQKVLLERAARTCPVALSVHPDMIQDIHFDF